MITHGSYNICNAWFSEIRISTCFQVSRSTGYNVSQNLTIFSQPKAESYYVPNVGSFVMGIV